MAKVRLDSFLAAQGLAPSREKARALILAGEVKVDGIKVDKAGHLVSEDALVEIASRLKYVSRGGYKLEGADQAFEIDFKEKTVLDVGASTGGYTDYALQNGAKRVFALDVGYGQLDWTLRNHPQVTVMERTNIRNVTPQDLGEKVDIITMDVSFISVTLIFPVLAKLLTDDGEIISLIKPQFEAGREKVGKKGVVRDPLVHSEVLLKCINAAEQAGFICSDICFSPITGPQGNIEFFIKLTKQGQAIDSIPETVVKIVTEAHLSLEGKTK